jgi:16S rRNA (uracil1498-N3)-methyltransferase
MEKRFFFSPETKGDRITLSEEESRHCSKVLRSQVGDELAVLDGKGHEYTCEIRSLGKKVELLVLNKTFHPQNNKLHLGIAPTKKAEKMEWLLEKLTELGLHSISFLRTEHSEKHRLKIERLEKKVLAALKQSGQFWLPNIQLNVPFKEWVSNCQGNHTWIAHCSEHFQKQDFKQEGGNLLCVAIGPEGDFSQTEIQLAMDKGFKGLHLGESRLRTETAGLAVGVLANLG